MIITVMTVATAQVGVSANEAPSLTVSFFISPPKDSENLSFWA